MVIVEAHCHSERSEESRRGTLIVEAHCHSERSEESRRGTLYINDERGDVSIRQHDKAIR
jgi:hypothetical protein